jgi:hypothetical protein
MTAICGAVGGGRNAVAFEQLRDEVRSLLRPGLIGEFDHIELVEIIGTPRGGETLNVLSVVVLSEGRADVADGEKPQFLGPRIFIDGFRNWSFGVARTLRPVSALHSALATYGSTEEFRVMPLSGRAGNACFPTSVRGNRVFRPMAISEG